MIVRIDVHQQLTADSYWQLKRCQVQQEGLMEDVMNSVAINTLRFRSLQGAVRYIKAVTFAYLEMKRHTEMPEHIEWRIFDDHTVFPCPHCHQPMFRKAKLGRRGKCLDLKDWGCPECNRTMTVPADGERSAAPALTG